jgi:hypothetical protein
MATSKQNQGKQPDTKQAGNKQSDSKQADSKQADSKQADSKSSGNKQAGTPGSGRGFASMDPQRQREIAAQGGRAAHASGNAHEFTSEEARIAGSQSHKNSGNEQSGAGASRSGSGESNKTKKG